jgi:hypothetical protein
MQLNCNECLVRQWLEPHVVLFGPDRTLHTQSRGLYGYMLHQETSYSLVDKISFEFSYLFLRYYA